MRKMNNYMHVANNMALSKIVDDLKLHYRVTKQALMCNSYCLLIVYVFELDQYYWLIDWIVFYAVSAIFQPYNRG